MICSQCGSDVGEGAPACPRCGAPVAAGQPAGVRYGPSAGGPAGPSAGMPAAGMQGAGMQGAGMQGAGMGRGPAAGGPGAGGGPVWSAPTPAAPAFNLDVARLTRADRIVGGASLVFIVSLFLPWFTSSADGLSGSVDGLWHGYMYIGLILALAVVAYLVVRAGFEQIPFRLPVDHERLLLAATGVIFVLTVISFVFKPSGDGIVSIGWGFGAFISLIAAIVAVAPLGVPFLRSRAGR
jgi:hypothetical protein